MVHIQFTGSCEQISQIRQGCDLYPPFPLLCPHHFAHLELCQWDEMAEWKVTQRFTNSWHLQTCSWNRFLWLTSICEQVIMWSVQMALPCKCQHNGMIIWVIACACTVACFFLCFLAIFHSNNKEYEKSAIYWKHAIYFIIYLPNQHI